MASERKESVKNLYHMIINPQTSNPVKQMVLEIFAKNLSNNTNFKIRDQITEYANRMAK
jgi:hypothetical protein